MGENKLSQLIAFLLDPAADHDQGAVFLKQFLRLAGMSVPDADLDHAIVETEALTDRLAAYRRRIDILVRVGGRALAIENKPWAGDQTAQVNDYLAQLQASHPDRHKLIYLSQKEKPNPLSISDVAWEAARISGRCDTTNFTDLATWVGECAKLAQAEGVRRFVDDFSKLLRQVFAKDVDVTEAAAIAKDLLRDTESITAAFAVAAALPTAKTILFHRLVEQTRVAASGWVVQEDLSDLSWRWPGVDVRRADLPEFWFRLEFTSRDLRWVQYGIKTIRLTTIADDHASLKLRLGAFGRSWEDWVWARHEPSHTDELWKIARDWDSAPSAWVAVQEGRFGGDVAKAAEFCLAEVVAEGLPTPPAPAPLPAA